MFGICENMAWQNSPIIYTHPVFSPRNTTQPHLAQRQLLGVPLAGVLTQNRKPVCAKTKGSVTSSNLSCVLNCPGHMIVVCLIIPGLWNSLQLMELLNNQFYVSSNYILDHVFQWVSAITIFHIQPTYAFNTCQNTELLSSPRFASKINIHLK